MGMLWYQGLGRKEKGPLHPCPLRYPISFYKLQKGIPCVNFLFKVIYHSNSPPT